MSLQETQQSYDKAATWYDEADRAGGWRRKIRFQIMEWPMRKLLREGGCLDLGCGTGRLLRETASPVRNFGTDLSLGMLRKCDLSAAPVCAADAHRLPFADASFRSIIASNGVFRYLNTEEAFAECARVLKPGGTLAVHQYPQRTSSLRRRKGKGSYFNPRHLASVEELTRPAAQAGFRTQSMRLWRSVRVFPFLLAIPTFVPGNHWSHAVAVFQRDGGVL